MPIKWTVLGDSLASNDLMNLGVVTASVERYRHES